MYYNIAAGEVRDTTHALLYKYIILVIDAWLWPVGIRWRVPVSTEYGPSSRRGVKFIRVSVTEMERAKQER